MWRKVKELIYKTLKLLYFLLLSRGKFFCGLQCKSLSLFQFLANVHSVSARNFHCFEITNITHYQKAMLLYFVIYN